VLYKLTLSFFGPIADKKGMGAGITKEASRSKNS
jgi:hypothetical protein